MKKVRYTKYIKPILLILDIFIINTVSYNFLSFQNIEYRFYIFISLMWLVSVRYTDYYKVFRFTGVLKLFRLIVSQLGTFVLGYFAYFGIFKEGEMINNQFNTVLVIVVLIFTSKILGFYALRHYRKLGRNFRNVVFVELDETSERILKNFKKQKYLGYRYCGFFGKEQMNKNYLGNFNAIRSFLLQNNVHEMYATMSLLSKEKIKNLKGIASETDTVLKLIPNSNELYSKNQVVEYYNDAFQIIKVSKMPFEYEESRLIKRIFDILFSFFVIMFVMSWLTPILWVLIKLESRGPLFFKQPREGLNAKHFMCYKFRSMRINDNANKVHATKNDSRVTKIGAFIRKTSIDELPQFFNVFLGDMSVVGPRPHMESLAIEYERDVENYLERHAVKPGITGLAQVSGFRGEIRQTSDIKNRIRLDIFYIENWSFLLDIKIIIKTVLNVFQGEENAY